MSHNKTSGPVSALSAPSSSPHSSTSTVSSAPPIIVFTPGAVIAGRWTPEQMTTKCCRCNKEFTKSAKEYRRQTRRAGKPPTRLYCSETCRRNPDTFKCPECGGWKAQMATTCKACYLKDKHTLLECKHCGKQIRRPKSEQDKNVRLYGDTGNAFCDHGCYRAYYASRPHPRTKPSGEVGVCATCKGPVMREGGKYCSQKCYQERAAGRNADKPYTGAWSHERAQVKKRFKGVCAVCGRVKARAQVHHVDHDAMNHAKTNLVLLCEPCHGFYHRTVTEQVRAILRAHFEVMATG